MVARIFFDEVDPPLGVSFGVDLIVVERPFPARTGLRPNVCVDATQEPLAVDVVAETLNPVPAGILSEDARLVEGAGWHYYGNFFGSGCGTPLASRCPASVMHSCIIRTSPYR